MRLRARLFALLIAALIGCAHEQCKPIVANPDVPNTFERCKVVCAVQDKGEPRASVEDGTDFRCFCLPKPIDPI